MFGFIVSPEFTNDVKEALSDRHLLIEKMGVYAADDFIQHCQSASTLSLELFIIDMNSTTDDALIRGIRRFRLKNNARIILIAPGREPGDQTISQLVNLGVWDIIAPTTPEIDDEDEDEFIEVVDLKPLIKNQLSMKYNYGNASRWHSLQDEVITTQRDPKKEKQHPMNIEQQIIFRDRIVGTVIIGVGSAAKRTGCTHTAIQIATFLQSEGHTAACIEMIDISENRPVFSSFKSEAKSVLHPGGCRINGIDFFSHNEVENIIDILQAGYKYILLDFGQIVIDDGDTKKPSVFYNEFIRTDYSLITAGSAIWDYKDVIELINTLREWNRKKVWNVAITYASETLFKEISESLSLKEQREFDLQIKFHMAPFHPDPFSIDDSSAVSYRKMLSDILPAEQQKKKPFKIKLPWGLKS